MAGSIRAVRCELRTVPGVSAEKETRMPMRRGIADAMLAGVKKFPFLPKLDPLGVKTGLELAAGGILALLLMRWFGM